MTLVGQGRSGACILNLLEYLSFRFIEAPFADENTPDFDSKNRRKTVKGGYFGLTKPKTIARCAEGGLVFLLICLPTKFLVY